MSSYSFINPNKKNPRINFSTVKSTKNEARFRHERNRNKYKTEYNKSFPLGKTKSFLNRRKKIRTNGITKKKNKGPGWFTIKKGPNKGTIVLRSNMPKPLQKHKWAEFKRNSLKKRIRRHRLGQRDKFNFTPSKINLLTNLRKRSLKPSRRLSISSHFPLKSKNQITKWYKGIESDA